ncbi:hypothetical protein BPOR_0901g00060 [Botrytis porri]|uniref:Major facilitator superfamily (MFS) profile domain-containing protein n=1 Tax=Botrytis porri TaxID=87229 RepID=A0A4Z1K7U7_9HELO|nr:hypothetical protein BPOR_0901g00060 [Botrytis porri]
MEASYSCPYCALYRSILFGVPAGVYGAGNDEMSALFNFSNSGFPYLFFAKTSWNIGAAIVPLLFVPLTETSARIPGYFGAYIVFLIFLIPCGAAQNFETMIAMDILGSAHHHWRASTRFLVPLAREAKKWRKNNPDEEPRYAEAEIDMPSVATRLEVSFKRPIKMLYTEWVVFSQTLWVSFAWGLLFLFQSSVTQIFSTNYNYNTFQTTLIQLSLSVGAIIATLVNPIQDHLYLQSAKRSKTGTPIPEARLHSSIPGSLLFTAGLFWYGWSSYPFLPWIVSTLGIGCVGFGIYSIYLAVVNYLTDSYEKYNASALSAASLGRNTFGAFLPLASPALYTNLGFQWGSSLLGFVALVLGLAPVLLLVKKEEIRKRSPFMKEATFAKEARRTIEDGV